LAEKPIKLFIGVCNSQNTVPAEFHWSWERMDKPYEYDKRRFKNDDAIVRNNQMVRDFLRSDCDIMVKMDVDQKYPENYLTALVPLVKEYKVVGPLIYNKWRANGYPPLLCERNEFPIVRNSKNWFKHVGKDGMLKIPYAHTNLLYAREVLEQIKPPWYEVKYREDNCNHAANRDFSFIEKINALGYSTYINLNVEVGHLVEESVDTKTHERWTGIMRRGV